MYEVYLLATSISISSKAYLSKAKVHRYLQCRWFVLLLGGRTLQLAGLPSQAAFERGRQGLLLTQSCPPQLPGLANPLNVPWHNPHRPTGQSSVPQSPVRRPELLDLYDEVLR